MGPWTSLIKLELNIPPGKILTTSAPFSKALITSVTLPQPGKYGIEYLLQTLDILESKCGDTTNFAPFKIAILAVISVSYTHLTLPTTPYV